MGGCLFLPRRPGVLPHVPYTATRSEYRVSPRVPHMRNCLHARTCKFREFPLVSRGVVDSRHVSICSSGIFFPPSHLRVPHRCIGGLQYACVSVRNILSPQRTTADTSRMAQPVLCAGVGQGSDYVEADPLGGPAFVFLSSTPARRLSLPLVRAGPAFSSPLFPSTRPRVGVVFPR